LLQQTLMASVLSATSNIIAQLVTAQREGAPYTLDFSPIFKFVLFTALSTPPNIVWQEYLEEKFPGQKRAPAAPNNEKTANGVVKDKPQNDALDWGNVVKKLMLDQTVGAVVNTVLFIAGMQALNGGGSEEIQTAVKEGLWPLLLSGLTLWPLVSLVSFTLIPVEKRIIFGSSVGVAWGVYLCLQA
ncbi:uncharacterized protein K452DRAFT_211701, partial [Aplosporella prunicola CBS 121167]